MTTSILTKIEYRTEPCPKCETLSTGIPVRNDNWEITRWRFSCGDPIRCDYRWNTPTGVEVVRTATAIDSVPHEVPKDHEGHKVGYTRSGMFFCRTCQAQRARERAASAATTKARMNEQERAGKSTEVQVLHRGVCTGLNKAHKPCQKLAVPGTNTCHFHSSMVELVEEEAEVVVVVETNMVEVNEHEGHKVRTTKSGAVQCLTCQGRKGGANAKGLPRTRKQRMVQTSTSKVSWLNTLNDAVAALNNRISVLVTDLEHLREEIADMRGSS